MDVTAWCECQTVTVAAIAVSLEADQFFLLGTATWNVRKRIGPGIRELATVVPAGVLQTVDSARRRVP